MRKRSMLFAFCVLAVSFVFCAQAMAVTAPDAKGSYTVCTYTPPDTAGYNGAQVYYPCNSGTTKFAATTLTGGYTNTYSDMAWIPNHIVTHGYIVFAMTPNNTLGTNPSWTSAHKAGITQLKKENTRAASTLSPNPIKGKVDTTKLQIMGFSKGGGGTLLASASLGAGVKTTQALAPYMDYTYNLSGIKSKTACYTGTADTIASPSAVITMYNSLPDAIDRTFGRYSGMSHTDWMTGSSPNSYGNKAKRYITAFMKFHLDGDSAYSTYLYGADHQSSWFNGYAHNKDY